MPANLDLNLLKTLHALIEEQSVTRAAARLSLTQPAVSGMLARLRRHFDDPLLVRTPQGMVPTERAQALLEPLARVLGEIDALVQPAAFDPAALDTVFKIGITDNAFAAVVLPFIQKIQTLAPNVKTAFFSLQHAQMEERLAQGALDAAITARVPAPLRYGTKASHSNHGLPAPPKYSGSLKSGFRLSGCLFFGTGRQTFFETQKQPESLG